MPRILLGVIAGVLVGLAFVGLGTIFTSLGQLLVRGVYVRQLDLLTATSVFVPGFMVGGVFFVSLPVLIRYSRLRFALTGFLGGAVAGWIYVSVLYWFIDAYPAAHFIEYPFKVLQEGVELWCDRTFYGFMCTNQGAGTCAALVSAVLAWMAYPGLRTAFARWSSGSVG